VVCAGGPQWCVGAKKGNRKKKKGGHEGRKEGSRESKEGDSTGCPPEGGK